MTAGAQPLGPGSGSGLRLRGGVEAVGPDAVTGWIFAPESPERTFEVELVSDGRVIARARADNHRDDLAAAGLGTGACAFRLSTRDQRLERGAYVVRISGTDVVLPMLERPRVGTPATAGLPRGLPRDPRLAPETRRRPVLEHRDLVLLNTNISTRNAYIAAAIADAARATYPAGVSVATYGTLVERCQAADRPLLLCIDGQTLNAALIVEALRHTAAAALWTFDDPYNLADHLSVADLFDHVFTNDAASVERYGERASYLPLAAPQRLLDLAPTAEADKTSDVFFCGTAWPNRVVLLNRLKRERPNLSIDVQLTYNPHVPRLPLSGAPSTYLRQLSFDDFIARARRSRITLSLDRVFGGTDQADRSLSPGPRVFEVGAAGAFQLCQGDGAELAGVLPDDAVARFSGGEDLPCVLNRYLAAAAERETIAATCAQHIRETHTYAHRIGTIAGRLRELARPGEPCAPSPRTRPRLLYVVHNILGKAPSGGLELHQDILAQNLRGAYEIYFFTRLPHAEGGDYVLTDIRYRPIRRLPVGIETLHGMLELPELERFFSECISEVQPDLVHFFNFINHVPALAHVARGHGRPYMLSVHDYYVVCRRFNLMNHRNTYCATTRTSLGDCDICLKAALGFPPGSQLRRREYFGDVLRGADAIAYMSQATQEIVERVYPECRTGPRRRVLGAPLPNMLWPIYRNRARAPRADGSAVRFVMPGHLTLEKGGLYLRDALTACPELDAEWHFHGRIDKAIRDRLAERLGARATFHGTYAPGEIDWSGYDFSLHLSLWPETYCQTLSEAWCARLVPIVTDLGALGERVADGVTGFKVDPERPATLARLLRRIVADPEAHLALRDNISDDLFLDQSSHAGLYRALYDELLGERRAALRPATAQGGRGADLSVLQRRARSAMWNAPVRRPEAVAPIRPDPVFEETRGELRPFAGRRYAVRRGKLEAVNGVAVEQPCQPLPVRNGAPVHLFGWVWRGGQSGGTPVSLMTERATGRTLVRELEPIERPDLAATSPDESPRGWGMQGAVRCLTVDEMVTGEVDVTLGWLISPGEVLCLAETVRLEVSYGG